MDGLMIELFFCCGCLGCSGFPVARCVGVQLVQTRCLMVNELFQLNGKDNCFVLVIVLASEFVHQGATCWCWQHGKLIPLTSVLFRALTVTSVTVFVISAV